MGKSTINGPFSIGGTLLWEYDSYPMTDPWCWEKLMLTEMGFFLDGIHGTPYIAAPWIRHG